MFWLPISVDRFDSSLRVLLLLFILSVTLREIGASASCSKNAQLSVFTKTVEEKGYRFQKLEVNRSDPVSVQFRIFSSNLEVDSVEWTHNDQEIHLETNPKLSLHYTIEHSGMALLITLNVTTPIARSTGAWNVTVKTADGKEHSAVCYITSLPILRSMPGAVRANVGSPLSVTCPLESVGSNVIVTWERVVTGPNGQQILQSVNNVTFKSEGGVQNAVMEWSDATDAGGLYLCRASSPRGNDSTLIEVRIKDYKTYLWPSIGILIEVILLVITITAYEVSQSKKRKAEEANTAK